MKQAVAVFSNMLYEQSKDKGESLKLKPVMELVIVNTNGKTYKFNNKGNIVGNLELEEHRILVSPEMLEDLITQLQMHKEQFKTIRENADKVNSLIDILSKKEQEK